MTICELINDIKLSNISFDTPEGSNFLDEKLDLIRDKAEQMEKQLGILNDRVERMGDRLIKYCNATEALNKITRGGDAI